MNFQSIVTINNIIINRKNMHRSFEPCFFYYFFFFMLSIVKSFKILHKQNGYGFILESFAFEMMQTVASIIKQNIWSCKINLIFSICCYYGIIQFLCFRSSARIKIFIFIINMHRRTIINSQSNNIFTTATVRPQIWYFLVIFSIFVLQVAFL